MRSEVVIALLVALLLALGIGVYLISTKPTAPPPTPVEKPKPEEPTPKPPPQPPPQPQPTPSEVVKARGALVDEVVVREERSQAAGIARLEAGEFDLYAAGISDPELVRKIQESPELESEISFGSYNELTFNPVGPTFPATGKLNPFSSSKIREAMNWLIDREYIVQEIYGGTAVPRYLPITSAFPDYARLAHIARRLELKYAHNPEKAKEVISEEMRKLGAELIDGKWHYKGEPVSLIFLIRVEDERREIGDYVATLLEDLGFVVDRQYKTAAEASPLWISGNPADGKWHIYTGGWVTTVVSRDQAGNFNFFYTPRGRPDPLWQAYKPTEEFDQIADRLARREYRTIDERQQLFARALELALADEGAGSVRVWLTNETNRWARKENVRIATDLAGGFSGSWLWPYTTRFTDKTGGSMKIGLPSILTEPWNPIAGSNWIFDTMMYRATGELAALPDPFTGLFWPQRIERAEVYAEEGLPIIKTLDWVDLKFVPEIKVPDDAWTDWDAKSQKFITVGEAIKGEKDPEKAKELQKARTKTVLYYDKNLFKMKWHDGSRMSLADLIMPLIMTFERANKDSPIYDEAYVPDFETFRRYFKGARIVQQDLLVVEIYSDLIYLDAEWIVADKASYPYLYPYYDHGPGAWHNLALGILAESKGELAFSSDKADKLKVDWMSYIAGPSLKILEKYLQQAKAESFIPFAPTLGKYIRKEEVRERYQNLEKWYKEKGHFWVGMGPFYLESVHPVEKIIVLRKFPDFPDPQEKWLRFTEPMIPEVEASGPARVSIGKGVEFQVEVTFKGKAYPAESIDFVRYLVFDAFGELVLDGQASPVGEGRWQIVLAPEQTRRLMPGSNRLEVIVVSKLVSIPSFESLTFATMP